MKLKEYIAQLQELAQKHPNATVIYSRDDEGNGYSPVYYSPSAVTFKDGWIDTEGKVNAVCLN